MSNDDAKYGTNHKGSIDEDDTQTIIMRSELKGQKGTSRIYANICFSIKR